MKVKSMSRTQERHRTLAKFLEEHPGSHFASTKAAYRAYLREMTGQGLISDAQSGSWGSYSRLGRIGPWKNNYCGTYPHAQLPAYGCLAKVRKGSK